MLLDVTLGDDAVSGLGRMVCCALTLNLVGGELGLCLSLTQRVRGGGGGGEEEEGEGENEYYRTHTTVSSHA